MCTFMLTRSRRCSREVLHLHLHHLRVRHHSSLKGSRVVSTRLQVEGETGDSATQARATLHQSCNQRLKKMRGAVSMTRETPKTSSTTDHSHSGSARCRACGLTSQMTVNSNSYTEVMLMLNDLERERRRER